MRDLVVGHAFWLRVRDIGPNEQLEIGNGAPTLTQVESTAFIFLGEF